MNRRALLCGTALLGATALTGCQEEIEDMLLDEDDFEADAEPAGVDEDTLATLGYEHVATEQRRIEREFDIAGESREIVAGNWVSTYLPEGASDAAEAGEVPSELEDDGGAFGILTTPDFTIAGQTINPVEYFDDEELIEAIDDEVDSVIIDDVERIDDSEATILGETTEVGIFSVVIEIDGDAYDGSAYLARVEHEDDMVVPVGAHIDEVDAKDELLELMAHVEHPV